ncbi:MAG: efflux RND transporter periplasmic adaptor subunit [Planctomycetes bacterium]|nr:efflux RND transporter periplasmic adaptor subunit [Planctomycetota bacterium]
MKLVLFLLAGGALAFVAMKFLGGPGALGGTGAPVIAAESTATARVEPLPIAVAESGYLKAKNSLNLQPKFEGAGAITWLVKEGKSVEADEVLVEFDKTELQTQIDDISNELIQYRTELESSKAEFEIQKRESAATVEKAEFALDVAHKKLELYEKGEGPNEQRKKRLAAEKAHSEHERAKERFDKVPELRAQGFLTKIQEEEERIALREKEIEVENADKDLELWLTYTQPMELAERKNAVKDGERELANAREKADIGVREKEARVQSADGRVKSTETRLAKLEKELGYMTIRAPRAGIVFYGDPSEPWMHDEVKIGNRMGQGNTVISLPDLKEMQVLIQVHEADIDLVKLEQRAVVTLEAVKGRTFEGKVSKIGTVANSNWGNPENKTFEVEITMLPIDVELRSGTTARVEIQVETLPSALQVPIHAVFSEGDAHFAFVVRGDAFEKRAVKLGKNNNHVVAIAEGLKEGERVLLYDPREAGLGGERRGDGGDSAGSAPGAAATPAPSVPAGSTP